MLAQPPVECLPVKAQQHLIKNHIESGKTFNAFVLRSATRGATLEAVGPRDAIANPIAIIHNGELVDFAGRTNAGGRPHVEMLAADKATVHVYIGNRALAPAALKPEIVERAIHAVPDLEIGAVGFTDGHGSYGIIP